MGEEEEKEILPAAHRSSMEESFYLVFWLDKGGLFPLVFLLLALAAEFDSAFSEIKTYYRRAQSTMKFTSVPAHSPSHPPSLVTVLLVSWWLLFLFSQSAAFFVVWCF